MSAFPAELARAITEYNSWIDSELRKEEVNKIGDTQPNLCVISTPADSRSPGNVVSGNHNEVP